MLALLPIKRLALAKQRLAPLLTEAERGQLSLAMATDVLNALAQSATVSKIVVCASDARVSKLAQDFGADYIEESALGCGGLNAVVSKLSQQFALSGVAKMAVLPCDIPGVNCTVINRIAANLEQNDVVVCPDHHHIGTNILAWQLRHSFQSQYGPSSLQLHQQQAHEKMYSLALSESQGAALDLDTPDDLGIFITQPAGLESATKNSRTLRYLLSIAIIERIDQYKPLVHLEI